MSGWYMSRYNLSLLQLSPIGKCQGDICSGIGVCCLSYNFHLLVSLIISFSFSYVYKNYHISYAKVWNQYTLYQNGKQLTVRILTKLSNISYTEYTSICSIFG